MSDAIPPGWWLASDGRYYPPETHPEALAAASAGPSHQVAPSAFFGSGPGSPSGPSGGGPPMDDPGPRASRRLLLGAGAVLVALLIGLVAAALVPGGGSGTIPDGPGTAVISWSTSGTSPAFSGTAGAVTIQGRATAAPPVSAPSGPSTSPSIPTVLHLGSWAGTAGGTPFDLQVTLSLSQALTSASFTVSGTYGTEPVHVEARIPAGLGSSHTITFEGTVGDRTVTGSVGEPVESGGRGTVHASFTVYGPAS